MDDLNTQQNIIMSAKKLCVIGKKLSHTLSPQIFEKFGLQYDVVELEDEKALSDFVKKGEYDGFNVTIPYKQAVMPMLDFVSDEAKNVGAVNTVVKNDGKYFGYNTDVIGMRYGIQCAEIDLADKKVAILGTGGTSLTAKAVAEILKAKSIYKVGRQEKLNYDNITKWSDAEIIINTTPVGMYPNIFDSPVDLSKFCKLKGVFDCIYNPLSTKLVLQARALGIKASNGLGMLVEQARASKDLFLGESSSITQTQSVEASLYMDVQNIVLIGMPGCGKTTIGKTLAKVLGKPFIDTDKEVEKLSNKTITQIFEEDGEAMFRKYESEVVKKASLSLGAVIATGGGTPLNPINRELLAQNGYVVLLRRSLNRLATKGRPLSSAENLKKMQTARMPCYEEMKDCEICANGNVNEVVNSLLEFLKR